MDDRTKQLAEIGALLARISNYDNRKLDAAVARDWQVMIVRELHGRWSIDDAMEIVLDHFALPAPPYFTVGLLVEGLRKRFRLTPRDIPIDVRVAQSRGLLGEWDPRVPVPVDVAKRLAEARADARDAAPELDAATDRTTLALDVGRRVPRE